MLVLLLVLLPFATALLAAVGFRLGRGIGVGITVAGTVAALAVLLGLAPTVLAGARPGTGIDWVPALGLRLSVFIDALGLLFAGLILGIGLLVLVYARFYLNRSEDWTRFFTVLLLFQGAMIGIVLSDNVLLLTVFWELTSLTSFLLIGFWSDRAESRAGARMALVITGAGGLSLLGGLLLLGHIAGSYELTVILGRGDAVRASPLYLPALLLILGGCFAKSAQFPFHFWLPQAMAAPTPVSAYLHSATMVKAGVFLLARLWPVLSGTDAWFYLVATTGLITMVLGATVALFSDDLKRLLAYSTVSHLGLLTMLFGFGTRMAAVAGIFHIVNHAAFKAALFMNAGIVDHETGTRRISRLGGLARAMPLTAALGAVAAASMAGLPPLGGFISKEMMLEAAVDAGGAGPVWMVPLLATLGAALSVGYSLRYLGHVYFGRPRGETPRQGHDPGAGMWAPMAVLVAPVLLFGLFPGLAQPLVAAVGKAVTGAPTPAFKLALWHGLTPALWLSLAAIAAGALLHAGHAALARSVARLPRLSAPALFEAAVAGLFRLSAAVTDALHTGTLHRTLAVLFVVALLLGASAGWTPAALTGPRQTMPASLPALIGWAALVASTIAVVRARRQRYQALIFIGINGLIIALGFVYLSAPDLALTQIAVETVTILLMLLALNLMPKRSPCLTSPLMRARDALIAGASGLAVGLGAWAVMTRPAASISDFYWENAYAGGGGTNVVNVILVDFRGFDTFGEIIVLGIAALIIFALLETTVRGAAGQRLRAWIPDRGQSPERHPLMLVVATRVLLPLALVAAVYLFLRGHNQPGGGFVAGLVISIALLIQYMASGWEWAQARRRLDEQALIAWGVLAAALTGLGAFAAGLPFLTSGFDYFHLPLIGEFELATAMLFDMGVTLAVVGAVMLALEQLSHAAQRAEKSMPNLQPMDYDPRRAELVA